MKKRTKRLLGGMGLMAGAAGAYLIKKRKKQATKKTKTRSADVWARPGMSVTFRAELMPGRDRDTRTFRVKELLPSGRVLLVGVAGEHAENEFERLH